MRRLTTEEVAKEVHDIETRPWPYNSTLPVKNIYDHRTGCIFRTWEGSPDTVRTGVKIEIPPEVSIYTAPDVVGSAVKYESLTAMVEAGWVAD